MRIEPGAPPPPVVELLRIDATVARALNDDSAAFQLHYRANPGAELELIRGVAQQTLQLLERRPRPAPFGGYLAIDTVTRQIIGTCGFSDGPGAAGTPEIAYFTFPPFERRGYATAMARKLIEIARREDRVKTIIAHTLPQAGPSTRILERCGFRCTGVVQHVEDGPVWRWELSNARQ
ncbi:MAG: GNAT family N-acetyltransferase [Phycisphaerae bacterium]|nr:GNAT family N-acetyltransferase [Phycisphaerae bacterium]